MRQGVMQGEGSSEPSLQKGSFTHASMRCTCRCNNQVLSNLRELGKAQILGRIPKVGDFGGSYFVARALGARVLVIGERMEDLVRAVEDATVKGRLYVTGELPRLVEDDVLWSVSEINFEQEGGLQ